MPDGITIFGFKIYFYGILIMLGALAATWLSSYRAKEYGQESDAAWDILPWALIGGIIGARLWHILTPPASMVAQGITTGYYLTHPLEMLNIRNGGLGIPGAVVGGFIAVYLYTRRKDWSILTWADIIAPGLALAQAIGRWGNFFNQELYGMPTNLPWKLYIAPDKRLPEFKDVAYYHPLFFYEFIWNLLNMAALIWISRRFKNWLKAGDLLLFYLIFYGIGRFLLEFLRLDPSPVAGVDINQTLMAVVVVVSGVVLFLRHRFGPADEVRLPVEPEAPAPEMAASSAGSDGEPVDPDTETPLSESRKAGLVKIPGLFSVKAPTDDYRRRTDQVL